MNTILDFVQSLQEMKKTQAKWASANLAERAEGIRQLAQRLSESSQKVAGRIAEIESQQVQFSLNSQVLPSINTLLDTAGIQAPNGVDPKPTGLISVILPRFFSFRVLSERLSAALLAGNGVFILTRDQNQEVGEMWRELLEPQLSVLPVRIFHSDEDELLEILCTHPAIQAVSFYGYPSTGEKVLKSVSGTWKKWQITSGYHNSALIMNEADLTEAARSLAQSCFAGMGMLHWNISNILVSETRLEDFKREFIGLLETRSFDPMLDFDLRRTQDVWNLVRREGNGKVLFGGEMSSGQALPMVVQDLSHCSTLHQDCLMAPLVLISPVKYAHEMVKWSNTSYFGMSAQIFAPEEKIEKFASQLEVSQISANSWVESMGQLPLGLKQSFSGIPDGRPFGGFYSDLRKVDRPLSRK